MLPFPLYSKNFDAKNLYSEFQNSVFQIRVIDIATDNKSSIGSGFLIGSNGLIATNYHVISQKLMKPSRYRLEFVSKSGERGNLDIVDFDIVHDIAIVQGPAQQVRYFLLDQRENNEIKLDKGSHLFSFGNPHDLGMSIVEGTYNGLLERSLYDKIFFTGSLNPGMSGGPTVDQTGKVIGINVSTAGNQLSFLVPVRYLNALVHGIDIKKMSVSDINQRIADQLLAHQAQYIAQVIDKQWLLKPFGNAMLPAKISKIFKCWGDTDEDESSLINHTYSHCSVDDRIFLNSSFTTGGMTYTYDYYANKALSSQHFYNIYSKNFGTGPSVNTVKKEDVSNYECYTDFIIIAERDWKMAFCTRNYKKFNQLFDISVELALVSELNSGLVVNIAVAGIAKNSALQLIRRFLGEIRWQK